MGMFSGAGTPFLHIECLAQMHNLFDVNWSEGGLNREDQGQREPVRSPAAGQYHAAVQLLSVG
jgi:hypothetical protein